MRSNTTRRLGSNIIEGGLIFRNVKGMLGSALYFFYFFCIDLMPFKAYGFQRYETRLSSIGYMASKSNQSPIALP